MTLFEKKKQELREQSAQNTNKNGEPKKVFSKTQFNELSAAYLNSPDFVDQQLKVKDGEVTIIEGTPVKDFRESIIGGIAKSAGLDKAEQDKLVEAYEFSSKTDYHSFVSNMIEAYTGDCGKKFTLTSRPDFKGSIVMDTVPETVKEVKVVGTDNVKTVKYGQYRKLKAKSTCPDNLRQDV